MSKPNLVLGKRDAEVGMISGKWFRKPPRVSAEGLWKKLY